MILFGITIFNSQCEYGNSAIFEVYVSSNGGDTGSEGGDNGSSGGDTESSGGDTGSSGGGYIKSKMKE